MSVNIYNKETGELIPIADNAAIDDKNISNKTTYSSTKIKNSLDNKANTTDLTAHTSNTDIHITSAERTKWNKVDNKIDKTDIVDNLTSTDTNKPLSAKQGKTLNDKIGLKANATDLTSHTSDTNTHITTNERTKWNKVDNKVDKTDIIDNLTSTNTDKPLSANQGKILKGEVDKKLSIKQSTDDSGKILKVGNDGNIEFVNVEISNVEQMKLNDTIFPLANNGTVQLEVTKNFEGTVTYETSNSAVATVSNDGLITKKANGTATITAKCKNKSVSCEVVDLITKNSNVLPLLNIPYLHSRGITGKGVKVALIEHLADNNEEFKIDGWYDPVGKKLYRTKPSPSDINGYITSQNHSYHMGTLIHGKTRGVAPDCEFYNILAVSDFYDENNPENYDPVKFYNSICDGIEWAIEFGIKVICICLTLSGGYRRFLEVFKKAYYAGVTICFAFGNCNDEMLDEYSYYNGDVASAYCLMMGACNSNGDRNTLTCKGEAMMFTNYGYPGLQCWNPSSKYNATTDKTSASTALTTGCVTLLLQQDPTLTPRQIYHIFKDNAILHSSCTPGVKSIDYGWGRINVPVLSKITYKSDAECKALDAQIPIEDINAVLVQGNYNGNNGFYKHLNVNHSQSFSCYVVPVEQDRYTYEFIPLNDKAKLNGTTEDYCMIMGLKPGIFRMLIRLKELGISKEVSFNVK